MVTSWQSAPRAFISGPLETGANQEYFKAHYKKRIDAAIAANHRFVIGPLTSGVDSDALEYLLSHDVDPERITVHVTRGEDYIWGDKFRGLKVNVYVEGDLTRERDAAMTRESDYDILRWRPEAEAKEYYGRTWMAGHVTNTEANWRRRLGIPVQQDIAEKDLVLDDDGIPVSWKGSH